MKTLKSIRIVSGTRKIEVSDENFVLIQIREILKEHREVLIGRLLADLPTYVSYKFNVTSSKDQLETIKNRLHELKVTSVNVSKYKSVIEQIMQREFVHVKSDVFYSEIDELIGAELKPSQLQLVN